MQNQNFWYLVLRENYQHLNVKISNYLLKYKFSVEEMKRLFSWIIRCHNSTEKLLFFLSSSQRDSNWDHGDVGKQLIVSCYQNSLASVKLHRLKISSNIQRRLHGVTNRPTWCFQKFFTYWFTVAKKHINLYFAVKNRWYYSFPAISKYDS